MKKNVGIIGNTGRMGKALTEILEQNQTFCFGTGLNKDNSQDYLLEQLFADNDYIVDFSNASLIGSVLKTAATCSKPLVICTTGWDWEEHALAIKEVVSKNVLVIAPNTSMGAFLQRHLAKQLAQFLDSYYDIDIFERHHRNKIDAPSGSALNLLHDVKFAKQQYHGKEYKNYQINQGPRPKNYIGLNFERTANVIGEHIVTFASKDEEISIRHVALNRCLFAEGALRILNWLELNNAPPGLYGMQEVLGIV